MSYRSKIRSNTPACRRNSIMQVSGIVSKRVFSESAVYHSSTHPCHTAHTRSIWSMVSVWPQWWQAVGGLRDKICDFAALVWPGWSWVIANYAALVKCWNFFGGPSISRGRDLCHVQLHPTWCEPTVGCRSWPLVLYCGPVGLCLGQGSILLVAPPFHYPRCHSALVSSRNKPVCLCHSVTRAGLWYGK